jgi:hypothetical protein
MTQKMSRGQQRKAPGYQENQDGLIPYILEPSEDSKTYRKNWASSERASPISN